MAAAIGVRSDYASSDLRGFARRSGDADQVRRLLAVALILNDQQRARLAEIVEAGPIPAAHGVVRWWLCDLAQWIWDEFELSVTRHTLGRELRAMGYRKLTARPRHRGQKSDDIVDFKKGSPPVWRKSSGGSREERR